MIVIPLYPNWGDLLDQAMGMSDQDFEYVIEQMWEPIERKAMRGTVHKLLDSPNPLVAELMDHWLYLPDPFSFDW